MTVLGVIALIAGVVLALYGNSLNSDMEAQLESIFSNGSTDPGNTFLYLGIAVAVVGLVLLVVGLVKNKKD